MSCKLISEDMTLVIINEDTSQATKESLTKKLLAVQGQSHSGSEMEVSIIHRQGLVSY